MERRREEEGGGGRGGIRAMIVLRKQIIESIRDILEEQKVKDYLANPRIPEVLANPDFPGGAQARRAAHHHGTGNASRRQLVAAHADLARRPVRDQAIHRGANLLPAGSYSRDGRIAGLGWQAGCLAVAGDPVRRVIVLPARPEDAIADLRLRLPGFLIIARPKDDLFPFWQDEKEARRANYDRISDLPFVGKMLATLQDGNKNRRALFVPAKDRPAYVNRLGRDISRNTDLYVKQDVRVLNIKEQFIGRRYYFPFDFMILPERNPVAEDEYIGGADLLDLSIVKGSLLQVFFSAKEEHQNREQLRKLAMYSRFISYDVVDGHLHARQRPPNLFLIMASDLLGPEFAPERYLQMLISAGWKPIRQDDLSRENLLARQLP